MHVWVITSSYPRTPEESLNAGVLSRDVALSVTALGHRVTVVTPAKPGGICFDSELEGLPLPWFRPTLAMADLSPRRPLDLVRMLSLFVRARSVLRRAVARSRPDGIIALWALPSGIFARWVRQWADVPYVVWLLGSDVWKVGSYPGGRRLLSAVVKDAAAAYADGNELATEARRLSGQPVQFLPSCRKLPPAPSELPPPVDVLYVGRYHLNKGPDVLLEAFALVHQARPSATLRLHGAGELQDRLEQRVRETGLAGVVEVSGPVSAVELAAAMASAKVLAIPSRIESIPLILADALQAGIPVVASDVGDMEGLVREYELGACVPSRDPAALGNALITMIDAPRRLPKGAGPPWLSPDGIAGALLNGLQLIRVRRTE